MIYVYIRFMVMHSFISLFHEAKFLVSRHVSDKLVCAAGEKKLRNTGLKYGRVISHGKRATGVGKHYNLTQDVKPHSAWTADYQIQ
jgi:hypothetical protein